MEEGDWRGVSEGLSPGEAVAEETVESAWLVFRRDAAVCGRAVVDMVVEGVEVQWWHWIGYCLL